MTLGRYITDSREDKGIGDFVGNGKPASGSRRQASGEVDRSDGLLYGRKGALEINCPKTGQSFHFPEA
jgi:hypothetical protein